MSDFWGFLIIIQLFAISIGLSEIASNLLIIADKIH